MLLIQNSKLYDALKYLALVVLPALGTLYFALAQIWGLPNANEVVGSIVAVDAFLGVVLHLSNTAYNNGPTKYDGSVDVETNGESKLYSLNVDGDIDKLHEKKELRLKINPPVKKKVQRARKRASTS